MEIWDIRIERKKTRTFAKEYALYFTKENREFFIYHRVTVNLTSGLNESIQDLIWSTVSKISDKIDLVSPI